jgi:hypothetical protein
MPFQHFRWPWIAMRGPLRRPQTEAISSMVVSIGIASMVVTSIGYFVHAKSFAS